MKITEVNTHKQKGRHLCESVCRNLTKEQRRIVEGIYKTFEPLMEVELTPAQITQLFGQLEQDATAAGTNRTLAGKGVDVAKQVNDTVNKVGTWLQNTAPVQGFDAKFDQLKNNVETKFPELTNQLTAMGTWAKENPGKTAAIIGVLTTLAALGGGPAGGAIAGQILRGSTELLKGEKLSTAIGKGAKAGVYGFLVGKGIEEIGKFLANGVDFVADNTYPSAYHMKQIYNNQLIMDVVLNTNDAEKVQRIWDAGTKAMINGEDFTKYINQVVQYVNEVTSQPGYYDTLISDTAARETIANATAAGVRALNGVAAVAQGAVTATTNTKQQVESLSHNQITTLFESVIVEAALWDKFKQGAGAVANKAQQVGKNITTKVTADKLQKAWKSAGSPTDSDAIAKILKSQGVDAGIIDSAIGSIVPTSTNQPPTAQPAQQAIQPVSTNDITVFDTPDALAKSFEDYMTSGGKIPMGMRGVLKDILSTALNKVENRQPNGRKL